MFHAFVYPFSGSNIVNDLIYVGYLAFMWGTLSLTSYLDIQRSLRRRRC
jgi:hypothetical protein